MFLLINQYWYPTKMEDSEELAQICTYLVHLMRSHEHYSMPNLTAPLTGLLVPGCLQLGRAKVQLGPLKRHGRHSPARTHGDMWHAWDIGNPEYVQSPTIWGASGKKTCLEAPQACKVCVYNI